MFTRHSSIGTCVSRGCSEENCKLKYKNYCSEANKKYNSTEKGKEAKRRAYLKNLEREKERNQKQRKWLWTYKKERGCKVCGETHPGCLQFHHRDPATKLFNVSNEGCGRGSARNKRLLEEIAKCDILCANCHFKEHYKYLTVTMGI